MCWPLILNMKQKFSGSSVLWRLTGVLLVRTYLAKCDWSFFFLISMYRFYVFKGILILNLWQLFAYDTVNKRLSPKPGEQPKLAIPPSLIAGACAGVSSTICTYPLELVKTRLTIQVFNSPFCEIQT